MYAKKEALLSSQIEGTQSTLTDVLLYEEEGIGKMINYDAQEVSNYSTAMSVGLDELNNIPISNRLIRLVHRNLMQGVRGGEKSPGEFRISQNWIGGSRPDKARFVPPPPTEVQNLMSDLEKYIHSDSKDLPFLIKLGLIHVQFETIHPFLDGNGRIGRLLIILLLCEKKILKQPILYLSLYLKNNRDEYYDHLQNVRQTGDWESWLEFFLNGIIETSNQAVETAHKILQLFKTDNIKLQDLGRSRPSAQEVHESFQNIPVSTISNLIKKLPLTAPAIHNAIDKLEKLGILHEVTGKKRGRIYLYKEYHDILREGTDSI